MEVASKSVDVLGGGEASVYLGELLNLQDINDTEIKHRIARVWAKFGMFKDELTDRRYPLKRMMNLFDAVVSGTVLYGCGSWTMTTDRERTLQPTQRQKLKNKLGKGRKTLAGGEGGEELECWVDWIKRRTVEAKNLCMSAGGKKWVEEQRRRKWPWAGRIAGRTDGRWTRVLDGSRKEGDAEDGRARAGPTA